MARALLAIVAACAGCGFQLTQGAPDVTGDATTTIDSAIDAATDAPAADAAIDAAIDAAVPMGLMFAGASSGSALYSTTLVVSHTVVAGVNRLLLVGISTSYGGTTAVSVTYGLSPLTRVGLRNAAALDGRVELWSLTEPPVGTANLTIAVSDANSVVAAGAATFSGVNLTTPLGTLSTNAGTSGSPNVAVASANGELVLGFVTWSGGYSTLTPASTQDARWNTLTPIMLAAGSTRAGAASTTLSWTVTGNFDDYWAAAGVAVK